MTICDRLTAAASPDRVQMNKELFGVFGDRSTLAAVREESAFDAVVSGRGVAVGVRDEHLGVPGRTQVHEGPAGVCVVWGEAFLEDDGTETARRLLAAVEGRGRAALEELNGSYLAVVGTDDHALVATDPLRSWECFYTDRGGRRVFGTDLAGLVSGVDDPSIDRRGLLEFLHLGTVLGERTLFGAVDRVPFDGRLTADGVATFDRFVYEPAEFDHAAALSTRLRRAIDRRADYPGRKGLLLSAGQDSRSLLAGVPDLAHCYTVGCPDSQEATVARKLAAQYGTDHAVLEPDDRYLTPVDGKVRYSQGLRESLHVHHAGYDPHLDVDVVYHGLLYDTLFKGYFVARETIDLLGRRLPLGGVDCDVDPVAALLDTLGYMPDGSRRLTARADGLLAELVPGVDLEVDPEAFLRESFERELAACGDRAETVPNLMDLLVVRNQPALSFRTHLADNYLEAFVAADRELLQWHLQTPPAQRHPQTVRTAIGNLDEGLFRHRAPGHIRRSRTLTQLERFARRRLPFVRTVEPAWPDRRATYERYDLDRRLFPDHPGVRELPARIQLRLNDLRWWLSAVRDGCGQRA